MNFQTKYNANLQEFKKKIVSSHFIKEKQDLKTAFIDGFTSITHLLTKLVIILEDFDNKINILSKKIEGKQKL